jgi:hypothetical protein
MSVGVYGINKIANIDPSKDVDLYYHFRPSRNSIDPEFGEKFKHHTNPAQFLIQSKYEKTGEPVSDKLIGMFQLNLPLSLFNKKGIYTILITPKRCFGTISDCPGVLSAFPDVRGVVLDSGKFNDLSASDMANGQLVGWRIDYYDSSGNLQDYFRIVTSNNYAEAVMDNLSSSNMKAISYRYNDSSSLIFCTVSPSSASSQKASALPYIGETGQQIAIVNTKFNSQVIEVEFVENDADTVATLVMGSQALNLDTGILTTYTEDGEILSQVEILQAKSSYTNKGLYNLRIKKAGIIDKSETYNNVMPS